MIRKGGDERRRIEDAGKWNWKWKWKLLNWSWRGNSREGRERSWKNNNAAGSIFFTLLIFIIRTKIHVFCYFGRKKKKCREGEISELFVERRSLKTGSNNDSLGFLSGFVLVTRVVAVFRGARYDRPRRDRPLERRVCFVNPVHPRRDPGTYKGRNTWIDACHQIPPSSNCLVN